MLNESKQKQTVGNSPRRVRARALSDTATVAPEKGAFSLSPSKLVLVNIRCQSLLSKATAPRPLARQRPGGGAGGCVG